MSIQDRQLFYDKLLEVSLVPDLNDLSQFFNLEENRNEFDWIFERALQYRDTKVIELLLSFGVRVGILGETNRTAIHLAAYHDFLEIIDFLFLYCDNSNNYVDENGLSHFHVACMTGNIKIIKQLLNAGVDVNQCCEANVINDCNYFSPLHFAVKYVNVQVVELLLENGANVNAVDSMNASPLHLSCYGVSRKIKKLIKRQDFLYNQSILDVFLEPHDELNIIKLLIQYGSNVNAPDKLGNTPLLYIFRDNYIEQINSMFHPFICNVDVKHKIVEEFRKRQKEKIEVILQHGADVNLYNHNQDTVLHLAVKNMKISRQPKVLPDVHFNDTISVEIIESLLISGANVNAINFKNKTPMQTAISLLSFDTIKLFLSYDVEINIAEFDSGNSDYFQYYTDVLPCFEAIENLTKIINLLLNRGFYLSQKDNLTVVRFLVSNNTHCQYTDSNDENAFYKFKNLLELGTGMNLKRVLDKIPIDIDENCFAEQSVKQRMLYQMHKHLTIIERACVYITEEERTLLRSKISCFEEFLLRFFGSGKYSNYIDLDQLDEEIRMMKMTMLNKHTSLHDILQMNLHKAYFQLKRCNYATLLQSEEFRKNFPLCGDIVKGHFTKSLVRQYVSKIGNANLKTLLTIELPDLCREKICSYLDNENILDLCLATTVELQKKRFERQNHV